MTTAIQIINDKLKDIDNIRNVLSDIKSIKAVLDVEIKNAMAKVDEGSLTFRHSKNPFK